MVPYAGKEYEFNELRSPRQEEVLSYLMGLSPVGVPFELALGPAVEDLGFNTRQALNNAIAKLVDRGIVRRHTVGKRNRNGTLTVLKRLEEVSWQRQ